MEFDFDISQSLPDFITKVDNTLNPFNRQLDVTSRKRLQQNLIVIIDRMGMASAKARLLRRLTAQSLKGAITTAAKLGISDHRLYILKETEVNRGLGKVVGILKVGKKKLFVVDYTGAQHECLPLCVLDFYVHESQQRTGNGKLLFEYMLKAENVTPSHLAIDRPSFKFLSFLQKHYGLRDTLPKQVNNFVVFEDLFNLIRKKKSGGITQHQPTSLKPPIPPTGRRCMHFLNLTIWQTR
ncbi:uncharacterized protein TRIADDRAFT_53139 [Trichoplax adhaerens]|uniref:Alpha-tubulin N-acetyltransferase n=1 Tax=Trichoplax adhaerens TaxID=10228 RepID=ATAT_TRIAD|nr:hypothetical protein TRIADDRAFT_53139 [Trichoplax adhaerens]B3RNE8.1 RecName: Full=Alpha-tubulin N-acetyltransferase; Short=Alpha-TAT; Short=TAT; AltName: Full=Acetyltransferase mec-17 homolog [Trichoplax adhaerens]EDV27440.1 hypothetical protein TRIADDRAFT_53139 [Trichoplax adhaerens]|eukprot:XP_002109274.1 hypothetical protein TRIADDRAFT_53139 [Trichoplax adhaerens]